jgi:hypothetical protein
MIVTETCGTCHASMAIQDPADADQLGWCIAVFRADHRHETEAERAAREEREAKQPAPKGELGFAKNGTKKVTEEKDDIPRHSCGNPDCPFEGMSELEIENAVRDARLTMMAVQAAQK